MRNSSPRRLPPRSASADPHRRRREWENVPPRHREVRPGRRHVSPPPKVKPRPPLPRGSDKGPAVVLCVAILALVVLAGVVWLNSRQEHRHRRHNANERARAAAEALGG